MKRNKEVTKKIQAELFALQDKQYQAFQCELMPTVDRDTVIGVRTPALRELAKRIKDDPDTVLFLRDLPHRYYEENNLHSFVVACEKDYDKAIEEVNAFLPYVDNWATCDCWSPKVFSRHQDALITEVEKWIASDQTYTIRYGVGTLMRYYLDDDFKEKYLRMVVGIRSDEYYVNMMRAWFFATALAKQYDAVIPYIEKQKLDVWTHNKAIQKAVESRRISVEQKEYLRSLKVK